MNVAVTGRNVKGFTLVEIMIVVAIIGILAAIAAPNFLHARSESQQKYCINNIRQIESGIAQYILENKLPSTAPVDGALVAPYIKQGQRIACPAGGTDIFDSYNIVDGQTPVTCKLNPSHVWK